MPHEQSPTDDIPPQDTAIQTQAHEDYEPAAEEEWFEGPVEEELPPRPRRRLLTPIPLALLGVLLLAGGFIAGALVQKGQGSSSPSSSIGGAASRIASLRSGAASGAGFGRGATGGSGAGAFAGGGGGATVGQVAYVSGQTLYVTNSEGNTVKVTTSTASTVTKTVKADVKGIRPGETVIVTGTPGANGTVSAESIRVSETGISGGLGALFGGRGGSSGGSGAARAGSGGPALFGG